MNFILVHIELQYEAQTSTDQISQEYQVGQ
jgi:hypothetical protein